MNLPSLEKRIEQLFDTDALQRWVPSNFAPSCDIEETNDHYVISADLPGVKKEDIKIELRGKQLSITAERKEEKEEKRKGRYRSERFYGSFTRSFTLDEDIQPEQVNSEYKDGVLKIALPKPKTTTTQQIKIGETKPGFFENLFKKGPKAVEAKEQKTA